MHDTGAGRMARRNLTKTHPKPVEYADAEPSALAAMLGGLIWVTDIDEGVTLEFRKGSLVVHNGLQAKRDLTIRAETGTVMNLSNLKIGLLGMPIYYDDVGRRVAMKLVQGKLRIEGLLGNVATLNTVTRIFSVQ